MSEPQSAHQAREPREPRDDRLRDDLPRDGRSREGRSGSGRDGGGKRPRQERPRRPAALLFEPGAPVANDSDRFFDLESMDDPRELLARATELALAFRAAAERATDFQAVAAAQLADPRRFDRLTHAALAERAGWTEDYAKRMVEYGEDLIQGGGVSP